MTKEELADRVQELTGIQDHDSAERVTETILETFCQRLSRGEVEDIAREVDAIRSTCSLDRPESVQWSGDLPEFLDRVTAKRHMLSITAETITRAVFHAIKEQIPPEETKDVAAQLPKELKVLWLEA